LDESIHDLDESSHFGSLVHKLELMSSQMKFHNMLIFYHKLVLSELKIRPTS